MRSGQLEEALLDESVRRVLKVKFEYGLFENPYVDVEKVKEAMTNDRKNALSEKIASKSLVLLKRNAHIGEVLQKPLLPESPYPFLLF